MLLTNNLDFSVEDSTTSTLSRLWRIQTRHGMILLLGMFKKRPHNQCFLVRGLAFITKKSDSLIIKEFGMGFYAVLRFTGQQ